MNNRRNITIAVVAILAIGLGLVVYGVLMVPHKAEPTVRPIVTAAMNIPARAHITAPMVTTTTRPIDQVQSDALGDPAAAVGQVASIDIPQGGVLVASALAKPTPVPVGVQVPTGMRAVSIPIDQVKGVAGLLHPGDKVDVMSIPARGSGDPHAYTFMRDIVVLAVGSDYANPQARSRRKCTAWRTDAAARPRRDRDARRDARTSRPACRRRSKYDDSFGVASAARARAIAADSAGAISADCDAGAQLRRPHRFIPVSS